MTEPLRIFIGYDPRQHASYTTLCQSIVEHASCPVSITPLVLQTLPITRQGLTPFTYSRFLVPWLCGYRGWALFKDCDMLVRDDIADIWGFAETQHDKAVLVAKSKPKFEWASVMLFNCGHHDNRVLTPEYVDDPEQCRAPHTIDWTNAVGEIPPEWNHLVGYDEPRDDAKLVHFTQGVPAYPETAGCEYAAEWKRAAAISLSTLPWAALMAQSVHAKKLPDGRIVPKLFKEDTA